jgi:hypothetical protein
MLACPTSDPTDDELGPCETFLWPGLPPVEESPAAPHARARSPAGAPAGGGLSACPSGPARADSAEGLPSPLAGSPVYHGSALPGRQRCCSLTPTLVILLSLLSMPFLARPVGTCARRAAGVRPRLAPNTPALGFGGGRSQRRSRRLPRAPTSATAAAEEERGGVAGGNTALNDDTLPLRTEPTSLS